ncbi:hypothetical protein H6S82_28830 [Planktothrix sp. FACHB-1355]|uniref:Uncharacterized protein n=1 Tax=Aerosakkonema funiforme FACHB-1375 TaxID=2949571 RepID=A0A926VL17_9CYAN|nr:MULTISPECIES: hypothetical protein [Oscillatoriales]MBD2185704.1 hypothetical protein [Aerosakkonema funiforme FACHB-1375]MBD3562818.1 hypothetical protein [Planktothrix sp. FACHB-1355]
MPVRQLNRVAAFHHVVLLYLKTLAGVAKPTLVEPGLGDRQKQIKSQSLKLSDLSCFLRF